MLWSRKLASALVVLAAAAVVLSKDEEGAKLLTMAKVMTADQYKRSGVASLSDNQRRVLDTWLNDYTRDVIGAVEKRVGAVKKPRPGQYPGVEKKRWLKSKLNDGSVVQLDDGSVWEIQRLGRIDTRLWLRLDNVMVLAAEHPIGDYIYRIVNIDDGEAVLAKYLGKR